MRRASARQKTKEREALFAKYDCDQDQLLSQMEVVAYAKKELSMTVDQAEKQIEAEPSVRSSWKRSGDVAWMRMRRASPWRSAHQ